MKLSLTKLCLSLTAVIAAVFLVTSSFAGPMPAEKNVTPMTPAPECTWTGFYIGGNIGMTEYYSRVTDDGDWFEIFTRERDEPSFVGGGQIGFNYQMGDLVFGIEGDAQGFPNAKTYNSYDGGYQNDFLKVDFMTTLRGRVGVTLDNNKVLLYATGGAAYAHGNWESDYLYPGQPRNYYYNAFWEGRDWRWGWTGGFGLEYMINCHWTLRGEAQLTWLDSNTSYITGPKGGYYYTYSRYEYPFTFSDDLYTFRVGVNYNFGTFGLFGHH